MKKLLIIPFFISCIQLHACLPKEPDGQKNIIKMNPRLPIKQQIKQQKMLYFTRYPLLKSIQFNKFQNLQSIYFSLCFPFEEPILDIFRQELPRTHVISKNCLELLLHLDEKLKINILSNLANRDIVALSLVSKKNRSFVESELDTRKKIHQQKMQVRRKHVYFAVSTHMDF